MDAPAVKTPDMNRLMKDTDVIVTPKASRVTAWMTDCDDMFQPPIRHMTDGQS
ncbi:hypothetical protein GCM10023166_00140 [Paeniglutamicibacter cryotolerans]